MATTQNSVDILNKKFTEAYSKILTLNKELEVAKRTNQELVSTNQKLEKEITSLSAEMKKARATT